MGAMPETGKAIAPMGRSCGSSPRGFPRRPHWRVACACGTPACHRGNDMYGIRLLCVLLACSLAPAAARVVDSSPAGLTVANSSDVPVDADAEWRALVDVVDRWWPKDHSCGGGGSTLSIEPLSCGCFCKRTTETGNAAGLENES